MVHLKDIISSVLHIFKDNLPDFDLGTARIIGIGYLFAHTAVSPQRRSLAAKLDVWCIFLPRST